MPICLKISRGTSLLRLQHRRVPCVMRSAHPQPYAQDAYRELNKQYGEKEEIDVAVRSSATAEDLPEASFAGQQGAHGPLCFLKVI